MNNKGTYIYNEMPVDEVFLHASGTLYNAIAHTIGPHGSNTAIPTSNGYLSIINDGKTILESLSSSDPAVKLALNTLKESAFATNQNAGDGTTSTIILQHKLLSSIKNYNSEVFAGESPEDAIRSKDILDTLDYLLKELPKLKKDITNDDELRKVITVSLGSDELTDIVFKAFQGLNKDQKPSLVKQTVMDKTEVISIDGVSLSPVEVNPVVLRNIAISADEPLNVLILKQQVSRLDKPFTTLLQKISQSDKKTILFYTEIMPSVMDQILFNIQEGSLNLIPVRLAMPLDKLDDIIVEMSKYFNLTPMNDLNPYQTAVASNEDIWGEGTGYIINKDSVIVKNDNEEYTSSTLPSKSTAISVGFVTYSKQEETYRRLEDAIHSAYTALNYGYTLGAGYSYFTLGTGVKLQPIKDALSFMFLYLSNEYDSQTEFINYIEDNVYDSYKVTEQVLLNAFTVVSQVLSTECILAPYR